MPIGAAIGGAAVIGAGSSIIAGNKAAKATKNAAAQATDVQKQIYDQQRADLAPWRETGGRTLGVLEKQLGIAGGGEFKPLDFSGFETSPGYQFRMDEATKALDRHAAAGGYYRSPRLDKELIRYSQGIASDEYNRYADRITGQYDTYMNRLAQLAGIGQTAEAQTAQAGSNYATGAANSALYAGQAAAGQAENTGNAINQGVTNLASAYLYTKGYGQGGGVINNYGNA